VRASLWKGSKAYIALRQQAETRSLILYTCNTLMQNFVSMKIRSILNKKYNGKNKNVRIA